MCVVIDEASNRESFDEQEGASNGEPFVAPAQRKEVPKVRAKRVPIVLCVASASAIKHVPSIRFSFLPWQPLSREMKTSGASPCVWLQQT
jgi:hypothetical protein